MLHKTVYLPPKTLYSGGPLLWLSFVLSFFSQQSGNEKVVQKTSEIFPYEKLRPLAVKPKYLSLTITKLGVGERKSVNKWEVAV